jgi:aminoglycoside phosphotransferase family enzyme
MQLHEALAEGQVEGLGSPDRVIYTHLSTLFVFGERVFKLYKHEEYFFADLSKFEARQEFITEDFFWNNAAAPEIYRHLWGVKKDGENYVLMPHLLGGDFMIEMSVIDDSKTLTKLLIENRLEEKDVAPFIDTLIDTLATLTIERKNKLGFLYEKSLVQIIKDDIETLFVWMMDTSPKIPQGDSEHLKNTLFAAIDAEPYFKVAKPEEYSAAIDANSDNLLLLEGKPSMIDIMPPRVTWRVVDEYATISRTMVDIEVLGNEALTRAAQDAYAAYGRTISEQTRLIYAVRAAGIQWAYRYMLSQPELAEKYAAYTKQKLAELEALL